jgi:hypothetical protein
MQWLLGYIAFSILFGGLIVVFGEFGAFYKKANVLGKTILLPVVMLGIVGFITTWVIELCMAKSEIIDKWWNKHCLR